MFDTFEDLPVELQKEAIREGEALIGAQFQAAGAADQRALTWGGFVIAAATASLGGGVALFKANPPDYALAGLALLFAIALLRASWLAFETVTPKKFALPGNQPGHWLPHQWGNEPITVKAARAHQAKNLDDAIVENRQIAETNGQKMRQSFATALWSVVAAGLGLVAILAWQLAYPGVWPSVSGPAPATARLALPAPEPVRQLPPPEIRPDQSMERPREPVVRPSEQRPAGQMNQVNPETAGPTSRQIR